MKRLPLLTAASVAVGIALIAPTEAKACEDCGEGGGWDICWSGQGGFGACHVEEEFDECGEIINTYCMVYYDPWCDTESGWGWEGGMRYDTDWWCWAHGWCPAE
jgi:hypothetical protein